MLRIHSSMLDPGFFFRRVLCRFSGLSPFFFCRYGFGQSSIRSTTLITNELFSVLETLSGPGTRPTLVILGMLFKNFLWTRKKPFILYRPPPIYRIPQLGRKYSWKLYLRSKAFRALPDMSYAVLPFSMQNTAIRSQYLRPFVFVETPLSAYISPQFGRNVCDCSFGITYSRSKSPKFT